ncbi:unnamed protein product [Alternaria sp. RS040]
MVWISTGTPHDIFEPFTAVVRSIMNGKPIGPAPDTICDIVKTFTLGNIEYKPGMQGEILEKATDEDGVQWVCIFIESVTETGTEPGDRKKWVPLEKMKIGSDWRGHDNGWYSHENDFVSAASAGHQEEQSKSSKKTVHKAS